MAIKKDKKTVANKATKSSMKTDKTKTTPVKASSVKRVVRNFCLLDINNNDIGRYAGKAPRQAALKIANQGITDIRLRETGVRRSRNTQEGKITEVKVHVFAGSKIQRAKTDKDPAWLGPMINIPHVKKVGIEWVVRNDS